MNLSGLLALLDTTPEYQALLTRLNEAPHVTEPVDVLDAARPLLLAALQQSFGAPASRTWVKDGIVAAMNRYNG